MIPAWLFLLGLLLADPPVSPHNVHLSYGRLAVEERVAVLRARYFEHDLLLSVSEAFPSDGHWRDGDPLPDSLLSEYLNSRIVLVSAGDTLIGRLTRLLSDGELVSVDLTYSAPDTLREIAISNQSLFDQFADQKNIWQLYHSPTRTRSTLYFVRGSSEYTVRLAGLQ